jgi:hypothetical protein
VSAVRFQPGQTGLSAGAPSAQAGGRQAYTRTAYWEGFWCSSGARRALRWAGWRTGRHCRKFPEKVSPCLDFIENVASVSKICARWHGSQEMQHKLEEYSRKSKLITNQKTYKNQRAHDQKASRKCTSSK